MRLIRHAVLMCSLLVGAIGMLAVFSMRSLPVHSGPPRVATQNGDVDCNGQLNINDPVYLLNYLFLGDTEPCAIAQQDPGCCSEVAAAIDRLAAAMGESKGGCSDPVFRMQANGNGTVTDTCTGLIWQADPVLADLNLDGVPEVEFNFNQATNLATQSQLGGHGDWRLPTAGELETLLLWILAKPYRSDRVPAFGAWFGNRTGYWTSTEEHYRDPTPEPQRQIYTVHFDRAFPEIIPYGKQDQFLVLLVRTPSEG